MPKAETSSQKPAAGARDGIVQSTSHRKFFIGGLPSNVTAAQLQQHFEQVRSEHRQVQWNKHSDGGSFRKGQKSA
jgi:hypothetical protein